jgi:hypothetical protein
MVYKKVYQSIMTKPFYNIIFCIFGCDTIEKYRREILKIKETWGKDATEKEPTEKDATEKEPTEKEPTEKDATEKEPTEKDATEKDATEKDATEKETTCKFLFFLGENGPFQGDDYIHLENVENDYLSASYKQYGGLKYIYKNYDFNYIFICGTDTYVLTKNLTKYLEEDMRISPEKPLVIGGHGDNRQICGDTLHFFSGGGGIILTKATMDIIYPELDTMQEEWTWICFENGYHTYTPACDLSLCYFLKRRGITFVNVEHRFFNCNYLGYYFGVHACCAKYVNLETMISCHHMSPEDFDNITKYITG